MFQVPQAPRSILRARVGVTGGGGRPVTRAVLVSASRRFPQSPQRLELRGRPVTCAPRRSPPGALGGVADGRVRVRALRSGLLRVVAPPASVVDDHDTSSRRSSGCAQSRGSAGTSSDIHSSAAAPVPGPSGSSPNRVREPLLWRLLGRTRESCRRESLDELARPAAR